jgi:ribosome-binding protein aMBF1 (putative translation factor)
MPKRTPLDWEDLERELHAAGVSPEEIEAGARLLLARTRGHQLAETRKQLGMGQKQIASAMGVSVARVSQIEHGEVTSVEVIARYVEALGGRLDLVADFGDRTVRLTPPPAATPSATGTARVDGEE